MPADLQSAPFGHSGNLPCLFDPSSGRRRRSQTIPTPGRAAQSVPGAALPYGSTRTHICRRRRPMASESSFDIVSKVDRQEVDNALNQAAKEFRQLSDFKNPDASIAWSGDAIELEANSE